VLLPLLPLRAAVLALTGWVAGTPGPSGDGARAEILTASTVEATSPVTLRIYDENHREYVTITLNRDGSTDPATAVAVKRLFRCKRTGRQHAIEQGTLAKLAAVGAQWPGKTIETVSGYRAMRSEPRTSPHRDARAIDFRVRGVSTLEVRDWMWKSFRTVAVGWYPQGNYLHLDHRPPGTYDSSWTFRAGTNHYHPYWSERLRSWLPPSEPRPADAPPPIRRSRRPGPGV
jgi:uncharacterized protein YcbK (DUF882 family)